MSDWIEWNGGKCPIPDLEIEEFEIKRSSGVFCNTCYRANDFRWSHNGNTNDIIAYRILKPQPESVSNDPLKRQVGGNHYKDMVIQPVEFIHKNKIGFIEGNVIKYVCRYKSKDGIKDLKKARHFIEMLIQMEMEEVPK